MMRIIAIDDEPLALALLDETLHKVCPETEIHTFSKTKDLYAFTEENSCDVAILDIHIRGISGIDVGRRLKEQMPELNIIFLTGYKEYTGDAMDMHASGYIEKPVTPEKLRAELMDLRYPLQQETSPALLTVRCFGNFEVYDRRQQPVRFARSKAKELFAYLVFRNGTSCSTKELAGILFEDEPYDKKRQGYIQKIVSSMNRTLREVNAEDVIVKQYNSIAVDPKRLQCDYYRFLAQDPETAATFEGEFMAQYYWAEYVISYLEKLYEKTI